MDLAFLCIAAITGMCAAGFLFAGVVLFCDPEKPPRGLEQLDMLLTQGMLTRFWKMATNWRTHGEARGLFLTGLCFLAITVALLILGFGGRS